MSSIPAEGASRATPNAGPRGASARPRLSGSILVVEDDPDIRSMTASILRVAGAAVCDAATAGEAISLVNGSEFDALILDWNLAGETGAVLLELLRDQQPGLLRRSLVVTGDLLSIPGRHEAERFGCPVMAKPFRPRQLVEIVAGLLTDPA
ncbi:MAG: response regulator [Candidatus Binatia bacterium]